MRSLGTQCTVLPATKLSRGIIVEQEASIQSSGKRPRDAYMGRQVSPATVGPQDINVITPVAAVSTQASVIVGNMGGV